MQVSLNFISTHSCILKTENDNYCLLCNHLLGLSPFMMFFSKLIMSLFTSLGNMIVLGGAQ